MMEPYGYIIVVFMGLALGSFISAFTYRFHEKLNWLTDRSMCTNCKHVLAWYDLLPIFSYLFLKGRCRYCNVKVPLTYPFMELSVVSALLFLSLKYPILSIEYLLYATAVFFLMILSWYDIFYKEVIDWIALPMIVVLLILNITNPANLLLALIVFIIFALIVVFIGGMGGGDIRIAIIGAFLTGWPNFIVAFEVAVFSGLLIGSIIAIVEHKDIKEIRKTAIPLIPFFTIGILIAIVYGDNIIRGFLHF